MKLADSTLFREACYVNGEWITAAETITVTNPADDSVVGSVPRLGRAETEKAIAAAVAAWPAWRDRAPMERAAIVRKWHDLIRENAADLGMIMTVEQGKPLDDAVGEIHLGASYVDWFAEECRRAYGDVVPSPWPGHAQPVTLMQSIGVAAAITPWNFPSAMITRKAAPALAAGCPVVVKPASATPFSAMALAVLAERAGFPAGVFNVVTGSASEIGGVLCASRHIRALSFTGSTAVGKELMASCAGTLKKLGLELGGNAPFVVFDDAELVPARDCLMGAKFTNAGQVCIAANKILVQAGVYEEFLSLLAESVNALRVGNGLQSGVTMGPMINKEGVNHMEVLVEDALSKGGRLVCGGKSIPGPGNFFEPTVIADVTTEMRIYREEIFGPIAGVTRFETEEQGIAMANDTEYGLAGYVFAKNMGRAWRAARQIEAGMVGVNEFPLASGEVPFGGVKESGLGSESAKLGLHEYLEMKYILLGGLDR